MLLVSVTATVRALAGLNSPVDSSLRMNSTASKRYGPPIVRSTSDETASILAASMYAAVVLTMDDTLTPRVSRMNSRILCCSRDSSLRSIRLMPLTVSSGRTIAAADG